MLPFSFLSQICSKPQTQEKLKCFICFQIKNFKLKNSKYSSVFQRIVHLQFCLLDCFQACFWVLYAWGFEMNECSALRSVRLPMPSKPEWQNFSFELVHRDTIFFSKISSDCDILVNMIFLYKSVFFLIICCFLHWVHMSSALLSFSDVIF